MKIFWNSSDKSTTMSFPTQWMQQQQSLQRHVVPVPTGNSMQRFLPNSMGGMGSFLGFMPANPMPTQTIPPSVQVNAPAVQVKTIVLYPSSVKEAFCDWKERFLNGEIEPHNPDFPAKTFRPRSLLEDATRSINCWSSLLVSSVSLS